MEKLLNNNEFKSIINRYSKDDTVVQWISSILDKKKEKEIIIPVLGMQGMGKSTLINAMLKENILPNEADETTCVPVEIKYGEQEEAKVYFKNTNKIEILHTTEELNSYVDNEFNRGNEKGVSHIVLYRNIDLLKSGVTIVDLPGVGSLTIENQETTMKYIKNLCTAIFVIPTTPTIRRTEEMFIKGVWKQFNSAIFVQNNFGESKREVAESVEFNNIVLSKIAKSIHVPYDGHIHVINAYDAICGELENNKEKIALSNINSITTRIENIVLNWNENEEKNIMSRIAMIVDSYKDNIKNLIEESRLSQDDLKNKLEKEEDNFKNNNKKLCELAEKIENFLFDEEERVNKFAKEQSRVCCENIRSNIYRIIDNGVVDGEQLTEAFKNYQEQYLDDVINNFYDLSTEIIDNLTDMLVEVEYIMKEDEKISFDTLHFSNGDAFKYEKGLRIGIDLIGAIGGLAILGTGIPGIIGAIVVSFVFNIIGKKTQNLITNNRAKKAKSEISPRIDEIEDTIKKEIISGFDNISTKINLLLNDYINERKKILKEIKNKNIELLNRDKSKSDINQLQSDYKYLEDMGNKIYGQQYTE